MFKGSWRDGAWAIFQLVFYLALLGSAGVVAYKMMVDLGVLVH